MNNNRIGFAFLAILMVSVFAMNFASAIDPNGLNADVQDGIDQVYNALHPITYWLFGADKSDGDNGFIAVSAFLLTLLVIIGVLNPLKLFGENSSAGWFNFAIAFIISVIGIRYIPIDMLKAFTLPSEGLIGAIFLIIPFLIISALILKAENQFVRRVLWVIYAVIISTLWIKAYRGTVPGWNSFYWVYVFILLACLVAFWFDGTLGRFKRNAVQGRNLEADGGVAVVRQRAKVADLQDSLRSTDSEDERKKIEKQLVKEQAKLYELTKYGELK